MPREVKLLGWVEDFDRRTSTLVLAVADRLQITSDFELCFKLDLSYMTDFTLAEGFTTVSHLKLVHLMRTNCHAIQRETWRATRNV